MFGWWILLAPAAVAAVVTLLTIRQAAPAHPASKLELGLITVGHSRARVFVGILLTMCPWASVAFIATEMDQVEALGNLGLTLFISFGGAWYLGFVLRKVQFSKNGIEVRAVAAGFFMRWSDIESVEAPHASVVPNLRFRSKTGKKVIVDATMDGWHQLVRALPDLMNDEANKKAASALREIDKWAKTDGQYA